jgi:dTDP-glucose pyrophosphorylase/CBS domain-containing protein
MNDLDRLLIQPNATIRKAIEAIDRGGVGIALLVDDKHHLIGTITDGDIRRAILDGVDQDAPATVLLKYRPEEYRQPTAASVEATWSELLHLMQSKAIRHVPLLDDEGQVLDLVLLSELIEQPEPSLAAVVMAGGYGARLRPLTEDVPKPMLPVGGRPLMERIIEQLQAAGIRRVNVTTHYKPGVIAEHFGDGRQFGVEIDYVNEEQPLGTAGALGLMETPEETLLAINGDILTQLNLRAMFDFHQEHGADMTVGVRKYEFQVPYGVIETEGVEVSHLVEKPSLGFFINAGIYLLEPIVHRYIPNGRRFDMTDLIDCLLADERRIISFPIREYWIDIGQREDYEQAQNDLRDGRIFLELD